MKLFFYIRYHTHFGESLFITGNAAELGGGRDLIEMHYFNQDFWRIELDIDVTTLDEKPLEYKYVFKGTDGELVHEFRNRTIYLKQHNVSTLKIFDMWNYSGAYPNVFYTDPFQKILLPSRKASKIEFKKNITHIFKVKAPLLGKDEVVGLLGDNEVLHQWDEEHPLLLQFDGSSWVRGVDLSRAAFPVSYKYGVYNKKTKRWLRYEDGENRRCFEHAALGEQILVQDGFINLPHNTWKGAGVAIPVFSLRSKKGLGIGEFSDLKLLTDWAVTTGLRLIQILPINDTTATHTWKDSYPYAAISAFALHPIYIHLDALLGKQHKEELLSKIKAQREALNKLDAVDYEAVLQFKLDILKALFKKEGDACLQSQEYQSFFQQHQYWLMPYAAYCYLRDKYQSPDPATWSTHNVYRPEEIALFFKPEHEGYKEVLLHCYIQYQLHLQLLDAVQYAHQKGVIIKGDIPIGIYRYGCDAWVEPELYNMQLQAGAPPDDFATTGQNWGFPTYNWPRMQQDDFAWWRKRFRQMSLYFDAFRIDHILGFFRIWSIPIDAVQGIMGHFDPCIPVHVDEFAERGIWFDYERFCKPYITDEVLQEIFGERAEEVKQNFLKKHGPREYQLLPEFDTQRKIEAWFSDKDGEAAHSMREGLYYLVSNVLLFEQENSDKKEFHFRIALDKTTSFRHLQPHIREQLWDLYIDYFYRRQNDLWRKEALKKLPQLKAATNMLICGEDLGMVPDSVPGVMQQLGILSLEIQRMPKQWGVSFFNPATAPYLSVVTPSTHDMSTIRGWWQENRSITQQFYNTELEQKGEAPYFCEPWINKAIVLQHLHAPAMWSIFQLQDLLGMSASLRRENPEEERINVPANPHHYWRYRMHITLEQLLKEKAFNEELRGYVLNSGR